MADEVRAWQEAVLIPTYKVGKPNKNPMFLEKRVYQGSSGVVYPYAVIDQVFSEKEERIYIAIYLENRYLKLMILPEIGGRLHMAFDKTNQYHFIYHNQVIKPALVGLAGPWISGGMEFNWPQHHRPSTFEPVDTRIDEHPDGSVTVWCSEIERMFRTKGMHGFTLYPNRAYLELRVQLFNRTSEPQTFLWWANPAVYAGDDLQSVFPPDVHAVMDHGKRDVSSFPIATGVYYKHNYAPGADISRYANIPVPTSFMAYHSRFDFLGSYHHARQAGMLHVADHHIAPGKKQWTWGCGDFGQAWDRQLTDEDGPYVELMCGVYTDNQPDFAWLMPGEEKTFVQTFYPYKQIGPPHNASRAAAIRLHVEDDTAQIGVYVTEPRQVDIRLAGSGQILFESRVDLAPEQAFLQQVDLPPGMLPQDLTLDVSQGGHSLVSYTPLPAERPPLPQPAAPAPRPHEITSTEALYLHALHLEQYRHATYRPEDYYLEALRRDPGDIRCNNAMGLLRYRQGRFADAEAYFRQAIATLTLRNPNPYDGEAYYNLGLALKMQYRFADAYDAFYKAAWNAAWQDSAYFELARLAARKGDFGEALDFTRYALKRNYTHHKARHLQIALLRRLGRSDAALRQTSVALDLDCMEFGAMWERYLLVQDTSFARLSHQNPNTLLEIALDYVHAGLFLEAQALLRRVPIPDPLAEYFVGWIMVQEGNDEAALDVFRSAATRPADFCFPNQLEAVLALQSAQRANPADPKAPYYLGNFWYAHQNPTEAIACWEQSRSLDAYFPTVHRNLGLAYFNKLKAYEKALEAYEYAFELDPADARVLFELDQLYKKLNHPLMGRLIRLESYAALVEQRDDLTLERVSLLNLLDRSQEALEILTTRSFHPWEGGEGKVTGQYVASLVNLARQAMKAGELERALAFLQQARSYPHNLGEGKLPGARENHLDYLTGLIFEARGSLEDAREFFERAASGSSEPADQLYYNDQPPEMIYYQGLALQKLGQTAQAESVFQNLIRYGQTHLHDEVQMDYFAVSLPDFLVFDEDLNLRNQVQCHYLLGLGNLGLGELDTAVREFEAVLGLQISHAGATVHRQLALGAA